MAEGFPNRQTADGGLLPPTVYIACVCQNPVL